MRSRCTGTKFFLVLVLGCLGASRGAADWLQFRGPNGSGVSEATGLPLEFGPAKNLNWKTALPAGHSSPVLAGERIFLTAFEGDGLLTLCLDRSSGRILWRRELPRDRVTKTHPLNNPASPTPASDGENAYVFFGEFGLLSYGPDGNERWRLPLGPFDNIMGMSASPILAGDKVILVCDQDRDSFMVAVHQSDGTVCWKTDRSEYTRGFATPILWKRSAGATEVIVPGSYQVGGYALKDGKRLWWVRGLSFEVKSLAVTQGDMLYVHGWSSTGDQRNQELPPFREALAQHDRDRDGRFSKDEAFFPMMQQRFDYFDFDQDGFVGERDWSNSQRRLSARNALLAVRLGGRGDLTRSNLEWHYRKSLPNVPSPLLYRDVLYLVKDGGVLSSLNPTTGEVYKQGRLRGAMGRYWASPVAADGKVYVADGNGKVTVLKAGAQWEILAVNDLAEETFATPAIAPGRLYVRTHNALYCFGQGN